MKSTLCVNDVCKWVNWVATQSNWVNGSQNPVKLGKPSEFSPWCLFSMMEGGAWDGTGVGFFTGADGFGGDDGSSANVSLSSRPRSRMSSSSSASWFSTLTSTTESSDGVARRFSKCSFDRFDGASRVVLEIKNRNNVDAVAPTFRY